MTDATISTLLAHQNWVRALARSLVADPAHADDVAQQTLLEAMTRPPRALTSPKGWLAREASPMYLVPDTAAELLLLDGDDEVVQRVPLHLQLGAINDVAL